MPSVRTRRLPVRESRRELWPSEQLCSVTERKQKKSRRCIFPLESGVVAAACIRAGHFSMSLGFLYLAWANGIMKSNKD